MIKIKIVTTPKEKHQFLNFPLKLYKKNPYFVPMLYGEEKKVINHKSPYEKVIESIFFLAYDEKNKVVGRIQGIIQKQFNEFHKEKRVRFTRFDSIDNQEVANALFDAVVAWAKEKGMDTFCGPLGYSDFEREGLLIYGFNEFQTYEEQYNYPYYQKLIENYGFEKEADWVESQIQFEGVATPVISALAERFLKRYNLHIVDSSKYNKKSFLNIYGDSFFDLIQEAYGELYGTVPFTPETRKEIIKSFLPILDLREIIFIADSVENIVAVSLCFPNISKPIQKSKGHLYPLSLLRLLHTISNPEIIDFGLIAVSKAYRNSGITAVFVDSLSKNFSKFKRLKYFETNLNLETNTPIRNMWKRFNSREHKRRRSFIKKI